MERRSLERRIAKWCEMFIRVEISLERTKIAVYFPPPPRLVDPLTHTRARISLNRFFASKGKSLRFTPQPVAVYSIIIFDGG